MAQTQASLISILDISLVSGAPRRQPHNKCSQSNYCWEVAGSGVRHSVGNGMYLCVRACVVLYCMSAVWPVYEGAHVEKTSTFQCTIQLSSGVTHPKPWSAPPICTCAITGTQGRALQTLLLQGINNKCGLHTISMMITQTFFLGLSSTAEYRNGPPHYRQDKHTKPKTSS